MNAVPRTEPLGLCLRCGSAMEWRHQTWECAGCGFKVGRCEGETGGCRTNGA